ncbi:PAS domain S-box-containing protein/diguanylate cyclase (GGDEF) domain-containing protein [Mariprofundus ferrinatatus]|uniref:PAS domain S-box-containing protein/diguanylate cyclase (GGDEF) domain-containing protein n=1 Tax=Mariprofundus ferrinatatus TaxID=1921087 RepID=A0A2K8L1B0_9PROT|nr:EAL domain-containing protein [Mariprofundus ferrinatatus]ATX81088.1 PAS domain S-box-containing protein/diguanylate cyclase (GGDEF) domain-containing protein [Mariprofundus ferrinatatus]
MKHKILIVDDQASLRDAYGEILEHAGFNVCKAKDYDAAIAMLNDGSIDLALLDILLEGKSGLDLLSYIRGHHPICPVIMMSGYADKKNTIEALRQGAADYLEKPIAPLELVHSIRHRLNYRALENENQQLQEYQAMHHRLKKSETEARMANERLNFLLTSTAAVIYSAKTNHPYGTTFISDNIKRMCGHDAEECLNTPSFRIHATHPDDLESVESELEKALERGNNRFEYRLRHKDGHYFWVADEIRLVKNPYGELEFLGFMSDITEHKLHEDRIREMAYSDLLTGLPNRSLYYDRLKQSIAQAHRNRTEMAVLFLDLDYFKPINDELGHEWGDKALIEVSRRLLECVRETDTVARIGGDEFSIILVDIASEEAAAVVADKIISRIQEPMILKENSYVLGVSIGICMKSHQDVDAEAYMRLADDAMYQAKQMGRNRYCIHRPGDEGMNDATTQELMVEKALRHAISNDELVIHYQPKVGLADGMITGMHALLRWDRGKEGMFYPDQFLPVANRTGLIVAIGEWVLRNACEQNRTWQDEGLPIVPVSVNVTVEQIRHPDFSEVVARILEESRLEASMLELEISESTLMQYGALAIPTLNQLNELGVRITIDNFGAGYFSLQALQAMPVHELKVNRSLIKQIGSGNDSSQITNAIISMGHILNHQVVAEGVETADQLQFLREHKSDGMLGYLSSPPVPPDEFVRQLKNRRSMLDH